LKEDSVEVLQDLQDAIADYIEDTYTVEEGESLVAEFTTKQSVKVDTDDAIVGGNGKTVSYLVPNQPIVIKEITTTKY
jgi:hypothetical protein